MFRKDVNKRSPLRVFERSIHGGLGRGNVGLVISQPGIGKSAFLIGLALDDLMQDRKVLHIDTHHTADKVREYYDEIYNDLAETNQLEDRAGVHALIERNRLIHSFCHGSFGMDKLQEHLDYMREHMGFLPDTIVLDGHPDFENTNEDEVKSIAAMAERLNSEIWMAGNCAPESKNGALTIPKSVEQFSHSLAVIVGLDPMADHVRLRLLKDHDNDKLAEVYIELDPTTLLLKWQ